MIPNSPDSLYDLSNWLTFKLYNLDTANVTSDIARFEDAYRRFDPRITYNKDKSFKVHYPRYRIDGILTLCWQLKDKGQSDKAVQFMSGLMHLYGDDEEFKHAYDDIVNGR